MVWYPMAICQVNLGQRVIQFPLSVSACFKRNIWGYVAHMYDVTLLYYGYILDIPRKKFYASCWSSCWGQAAGYQPRPQAGG